MPGMTGPITWEFAYAICIILGAIIGVWLRIEYRIQSMITPIKTEISKRIDDEVKLAQTQVSALQASHRLLENQLGEHKLYAAEHYARNDAVQSMRDEVLGRLDAINGRLDQVLIPHLPPVPTPPRRTRG